MDLEHKPTVDLAPTRTPPAEAVVERKSTRRQEIRAALLAVPVVLTLTSNANAAAGEYGYSP